MVLVDVGLVLGGGDLVHFSVWRWFWGLRFLLCVGFSVGWSAGAVLRFVGLVGVWFWCLCVLVGGWYCEGWFLGIWWW